jgi:hypothetical protein
MNKEHNLDTEAQDLLIAFRELLIFERTKTNPLLTPVVDEYLERLDNEITKLQTNPKHLRYYK